MKKHFVHFLSPGTLVHEESSYEIDSWDIDKAKKMSKKIKERHGATPFAFFFTTRSRGQDDLDSKVVASSPNYYLGGKIMTLNDVKRQMSSEKILISNMECNKWDRIIINTNSYRITQPLNDDDVVLQYP